MKDEFLFSEKYRPKTIDDVILPKQLKTIFQSFINQKNVPNLILSGQHGVGKTTIARALLEQLDCDYIMINGSLNGNIDTLRNEILNFVSSVSLSGGRKYVIFDEADYLNPNSTQPALRGFIEEFSKNCGFIFTCNFKNKLIEPLHSRCTVIDFKIDKKQSAVLASEFFIRLKSILDKEHIKYDPKVLAEFINKYYPDWRRIINEVQTYGSSGIIDTGILVNFYDESVKTLVGLLKTKNFSEIRRWVGENFNNNQQDIFRGFYDNSVHLLVKSSVPQLIILIANYQFKSAFVADQEINLMAFFVECMLELEFI